MDIYIGGSSKKRDIIARYLSKEMNMVYDTDGENLAVFQDVSFDCIPKKFFEKKNILRKLVDIRENKKGNPVNVEAIYA